MKEVAVDVVNLDELQPLARQKLDPMAYDYIASGAEDEWTLRENKDAYRRIKLRPRVLVDVSKQDLSTEVLGARVELPVMLAPVAMHQLACPQGELASARAAGALGALLVLSTLSSCSLEEVAQATSAPRWFQLYCFKDREVTKTLVQRAQANGYKALVVTVDAPKLGRREADIRNQFHLPPGVVLKNLEGLTVPDVPEELHASALAAYAASMLDSSLNWASIEWLRSLTSLPIVLKGIHTAQDAKLSVEHGVAGIIVSNHGGRQLDGVPATIEILPEVVEAVGGQLEILVDGGVRRGTDVLKALALGARAVLIGRPYIWGLALNGEAGVKRVLSMLKEELALAMALAGCPTLADIRRELVVLPSA